MDRSLARMPLEVPAVLGALLDARDSASRDHAWESFIAQHSRLIMHAIKQCGGAHDTIMDRYAFVLDQLRAHDYRRLRTWASDGRSQLSTWLTVVVKRLCYDHHRQTYGRQRAVGSDASEARQRRRLLVDMVAAELRPEAALPEDGTVTAPDDPELAVRRFELLANLARGLADLSPSDRVLLALRFRDELPASRIARLLGFPTPFHVYRRLTHVLDTLRRALERQGIEDAAP